MFLDTAEGAPAPIPAHHHAAGWRRHRSANSGRYFFYNIATHESRWDLPLVEEPRAPQLQLPAQPRSASAPAAISAQPRSASAPAAIPATPQPDALTSPPSFGSNQATMGSTSSIGGSSNSSVSSSILSDSQADEPLGIPDADDRDVSARFHLGGKRYVVVKRYKRQPFINIREYYQPKDRVAGRLFAGKKGINLTIDQWRALCKNMQSINQTLATFTRQ